MGPHRDAATRTRQAARPHGAPPDNQTGLRDPLEARHSPRDSIDRAGRKARARPPRGSGRSRPPRRRARSVAALRRGGACYRRPVSAPRAPLRLLPLALLLACQPAANVERPAGAGSEAVATPQPSLAKGALLSIASDEYGAFSPAPGALGVGDKAPDFETR